MRTVSEGRVRVPVPEGVFYNPEMELCRDISSLCVGSLGGKLSVLDGMCASGIRGLRYKKENRNVGKLVLSDMSRKAVSAARKSAKANKVKCKVLNADARELLRKSRGTFDFVELDPFGSPVPFLYDAASAFEESEGGYISATATDMAVLCGASHAACLKNYGAAPLNCEFCHENAVRILAGKVAFTCSPFNLAAVPIYSISHRHYVKVIFRLENGADGAVEAVKKTGYVSYCPACCWRKPSRLPQDKVCPECSHQLMHGGPLWLGKLWDGGILGRMVALNAERSYAKAKLAEKMLRMQLAESKIDAYGYYDLHVLARKLKGKIASMDDALEKLRASGFAAERTHFCPTAIRTDAPHKEIARMARSE
ncbi:MAG: tRNA (guanine(10)-N(2))-dimethyltransferase [Candidatus Anstonellaceae archaeon]